MFAVQFENHIPNSVRNAPPYLQVRFGTGYNPTSLSNQSPMCCGMDAVTDHFSNVVRRLRARIKTCTETFIDELFHRGFSVDKNEIIEFHAEVDHMVADSRRTLTLIFGEEELKELNCGDEVRTLCNSLSNFGEVAHTFLARLPDESNVRDNVSDRQVGSLIALAGRMDKALDKILIRCSPTSGDGSPRRADLGEENDD